MGGWDKLFRTYFSLLPLFELCFLNNIVELNIKERNNGKK